jgi:23S rRNA (guanosine2251-2'-O)-methyltransferase
MNQAPGDWLYGIAPVEEALRAGKRLLRELLVRAGGDSERVGQIRELAAERAVPVTEYDRHDFDRRLRGQNHQGVALNCGALPLRGFRELLDPEPEGIVLALDQIEDPHNLGALVRTAAFLGIRGALLHRSRRAPISSAVSKASAGAVEFFDLFECGNLADVLQRFARKGWRIVGSALDDDALPLGELAAGGPCMLVVGNEGRGLRPLTRKRCTELVRIERRGRAESLNVSVAAGILLAHLTGADRPV